MAILEKKARGERLMGEGELVPFYATILFLTHTVSDIYCLAVSVTMDSKEWIGNFIIEHCFVCVCVYVCESSCL